MSMKSYPRRLVAQALIGAVLCIGGSHAIAANGGTEAAQAANANANANANGEAPAKGPRHELLRAKVAHPKAATKPQRAVKALKQK